MRRSADLKLLDARKVLDDTNPRGNRRVQACGDLVLVLVAFSKTLPSVHGVSQKVYEADCTDLRSLRLRGIVFPPQ